MRRPCFGRGYPNALGICRGGCSGRPPGQVIVISGIAGVLAEPLDPPLFQFERCDDFRDAQPPHRPHDWRQACLWLQTGRPGGINQSVLWKYFFDDGDGWAWWWELQIFYEGFDPSYHRWVKKLPVPFNCAVSTDIQHAPLPGSDGVAVDPGLALTPAPYDQLPADYCRLPGM